MARQRKAELLTCNPGAIVRYANQLRPAGRDVDFDRTSSCIERVLDQLFHDGGRSLDDFAGSDLIDELRG